MNYKTDTPASPSLAYHYDGVHVLDHNRSQGVILAASEEEARLLLRHQHVVALRLSLVSAANPLVSSQSAAHSISSPWLGLISLITGTHHTWQTQTLTLLVAALEHNPLLPALTIVERQLVLLKAPPHWPAAILMWREGLAKGLSCSEVLGTFKTVWGNDWLAWVQTCELLGMPTAPLAPWIRVEQKRQKLRKAIQPAVWRCYGWSIALALLTSVIVFQHPGSAAVWTVNTLGISLPILLAAGWAFHRLNKRLSWIPTAFQKNTLRNGWAAWWMALHLEANDTDNLSPLEALQLAVQIPSAQHAPFLSQTLAAVEAGQPLEVALSQSLHLPVKSRLRFETIQDSVGLRQAIETCWQEAEEKAQEQTLCWWTGLDIILTIMSAFLALSLTSLHGH